MTSQSKPKQIFPNWLPVQVAQFYEFPMEFTGKGQTIAIISLGGPINMNELEKDFHAMRVPMPDIKTVDVDPDSITSQQNDMGSIETHLDLEVVGSICPGADITIYRGPNPSGLADTVKKAVEDKNSIISISWGTPETFLDKNGEMETVLENAKSQGITVCAAAGDGGSSDERDPKTGDSIPAFDNKAHPNYPASSAYVLACGGTQLVSENSIWKEVVWNTQGKGGGAGGGGVSDLFNLPSWQSDAGINIPSANNGNIGRVLPDVAGLASGGDWKIYQSGRGKLVGGTSAVTPLWASLIALINEKREQAGKAPLGFINERLYQLARQGGLFNDITQGNNRPTPDYPGYEAAPGFDACSGWGTPIGSKLVEALTNLD
ncbi:MAG: S8 family serine peptidase [bacterium]|nr:S8 family serine peptidase [bacterium]